MRFLNKIGHSIQVCLFHFHQERRPPKSKQFSYYKNCIGSFGSKKLHLGPDLQKKNCILSLIYYSYPGSIIGTLLYPCLNTVVINIILIIMLTKTILITVIISVTVSNVTETEYTMSSSV